MKRTAIACVVVLGGFLSLPLRAADQGPGGWGPGRGRGPGMGGPMFGLLHNQRVKAELGLTDEQSEKLRKLFSETHKASIRSRAELKIKRMELHELMMASTTDREAAMKKVTDISDLRAQRMRQHVESMLAAKTILTPEQQKKIHTMMADRMSRRGEGFRGRRGSGRGPGGPPREFAPEPDED